MSEQYNDDSEKSLEELAREAIDAIKKAEKLEQLRIEQEDRDAIKAQENLKQEIQNKIKRKLRAIQKSESKKPKDSIDTSHIVSWKNADKMGVLYEGEYNEKSTFTIKRGLNLYHLYVVDNNLMIEGWQKSTCTSISLETLKQKADKILLESIKRQKEIKRLDEIKKSNESGNGDK